MIIIQISVPYFQSSHSKKEPVYSRPPAHYPKKSLSPILFVWGGEGGGWLYVRPATDLGQTGSFRTPHPRNRSRMKKTENDLTLPGFTNALEQFRRRAFLSSRNFPTNRALRDEMKNREGLGLRFVQSKMASLRTVPERLLRPAARSVSAGGRGFLSPRTSLGKPRMYRAALCKELGKPLVVQEVPATENLKSTQVCFYFWIP